MRRFKTAQPFLLSDFRLISNTLGCIYSNNTFNQYDEYYQIDIPDSAITTNPLSRKPTIKRDRGESFWDGTGQRYSTKYTCPQISGKNAYILDLRLNPDRPYTITFGTGLIDMYHTPLSKPIIFSAKTGPTALKDQYLYDSYDDTYGSLTKVIPSDLPIVLGLSSVNLDRIDLQACELTESQYIQYILKDSSTLGLSPNCTNPFRKSFPIKNRYWDLTSTKVDVEKDILGKSFDSPYVVVSGEIAGANIMD